LREAECRQTTSAIFSQVLTNNSVAGGVGDLDGRMGRRQLRDGGVQQRGNNAMRGTH